MFSTLQSAFEKLGIDYKKPSIDNWVFKLHYRLTFALLGCAGFFIFSFEYFNKEKISCAHSDTEEDSNKKIKGAIAQYCFFVSLFTVPKHFNRSVSDGEASHPGIGPYRDGEEKTSVLWYQWVPYVLLTQAIFFYIPHYIWKYLEKKRIKKVVQHMTSIKFYEIIEEKEQDKYFEEAFSTLKSTLEYHRDWHIQMIACEALNLINVIIQMSITDSFLGGKFWTLGSKFYEHYGNERFNYLDVVFPKAAKCSLRRFGKSGSVQLTDILCILPLNVINEKFFTLLWFWYIILITLSALVLVHRLLSFVLYKTRVQYNAQLLTHHMAVKPSLQDTLLLVEHLQFGEWFYLHFLVSNLDPHIGARMIKSFANIIRNGGSARFRHLRNFVNFPSSSAKLGSLPPETLSKFDFSPTDPLVSCD